MRHYLNIKVRNNFGVMSNVSGLFARRAYNIDSIAVGTTEDSKISKITIVVHGSDQVINQICTQVEKLPDVISIQNLSYNQCLTREFCLITVKVTSETRLEILGICDVFKASVVDMAADSLIIEGKGTPRQVKAFIAMLEPFGIKDISRTGLIALPFESQTID